MKTYFNLKELVHSRGGQTILYSHMAGGEQSARMGVGEGTDFSTLGPETTILVIASDIHQEAPLWWLRLRNAARNGVKLIVANPRPTRLDEFATHIVRYQYGQEAAVLSAFEPGGKGFLAEVNEQTGREFAEATNAILFFGSEGIGLIHSEALAQAGANLLYKTGHWGKPNNGIIGVWPHGNTQGAWDMGYKPCMDMPDLRPAPVGLLGPADGGLQAVLDHEAVVDVPCDHHGAGSGGRRSRPSRTRRRGSSRPPPKAAGARTPSRRRLRGRPSWNGASGIRTSQSGTLGPGASRRSSPPRSGAGSALPRGRHRGVERLADDVADLLLHPLRGPVVPHPVLHPFEVVPGDAPAPAEDVGDDERAPALQRPVGRRRHRVVGDLGDDPRRDGVHVRLRHLQFHGGEDQDVRRDGEEAPRVGELLDVRLPLQPVEDPVGLLVPDHLLHVDPVLVPVGAADVLDRDHLRPVGVEEPGDVRPHLPEALDGHPRPAEVESLGVAGPADAEVRPDRPQVHRGGRAAEVRRLPEHDGGGRVAEEHAVGVHEPAHDLLVRPDVGGEDVQVRLDEPGQIRQVLAGDALQLPHRVERRVAVHRPVGAAEGDPQQRAAVGRPEGEGLDGLRGESRPELDPSHRRPPRRGVDGVVGGEDPGPPVVHLDGEAQAEGPPGLLQDGRLVLREAEVARCGVELGQHVRQRAQRPFRFDRDHPSPPFAPPGAPPPQA